MSDFWKGKLTSVTEEPEETWRGTTLVIDADSLAYAAASSTDGRVYKVKGLEEGYKYKKDALAAAKNPEDITLEYHPEPVSHALHNTKQGVQAITKEFPGAEAELYISGSLNFRNSISADYKSNRDDIRRPEHLAACKQYLVDRFQAKGVEGLEADDLVGARATQLGPDKCIICAIDKDLLMIPGRHYNWNKQTLTTVDTEEGLRMFYRQCLTGDSTDNILGLYKVGPATAAKLITDEVTDELQMYRIARVQWLLSYRKRSPKTRRSEIIANLHTSAMLLWIQKEYWKLWEPPVK